MKFVERETLSAASSSGVAQAATAEFGKAVGTVAASSTEPVNNEIPLRNKPVKIGVTLFKRASVAFIQLDEYNSNRSRALYDSFPGFACTEGAPRDDDVETLQAFRVWIDDAERFLHNKRKGK